MKSTLNLLIIILSFLMKPHQWKAFNNSTSPLYCINTLRFLFVWISLYLLFTNCQESEQEVKHDEGQTVYFIHAETRGSQDVYVILYITCQHTYITYITYIHNISLVKKPVNFWLRMGPFFRLATALNIKPSDKFANAEVEHYCLNWCTKHTGLFRENDKCIH